MRIGIAFLLALLAGCALKPSEDPATGTSPDSNWWMFRADLAHTGHVREPVPMPPLVQKWNRALVSGMTSLTPPAFGRNAIFIGSGYGGSTLYALSKADGATIWSFSDAPYGFYGAPVSANGHVYVLSLGTATKVIALRAQDGSVAWQTLVPAVLGASPAVAFGMVFVSGRNGMLYALEQETGAIAWSSDISPDTFSASSPAIGFGRVFVGSSDGMYAFRDSDGLRKWKFTTSSVTGWSAPVIHSDVGLGNPVLIFITTADRKLYAVSLPNHTAAWTFPGDAALHGASVAVADRKVFLNNWTHVTALDATSGNTVWDHQTAQGTIHSPAIANGILYYTDTQKIYALRISDGIEIWNAPIAGNGDANAPGNEIAIADGLVVVPNKGHVYAFGN